MGFVRRVVTGHDLNGKAVVISDDLAPAVNSKPLRPGQRSTDLWKTSGMPVRIEREEPDPTLGPWDFVPAMGTKIRIVDIPPETEEMRNITPEKAGDLFRQGGHGEASSVGSGKRHPLMHRTRSVDYAVMLDGELTMLLDEDEVLLKAGDVLIQRGTNHAWINRSDGVARILFVFIDARFDDDLAAQLEEGPRR